MEFAFKSLWLRRVCSDCFLGKSTFKIEVATVCWIVKTTPEDYKMKKEVLPYDVQHKVFIYLMVVAVVPSGIYSYLDSDGNLLATFIGTFVWWGQSAMLLLILKVIVGGTSEQINHLSAPLQYLIVTVIVLVYGVLVWFSYPD